MITTLFTRDMPIRAAGLALIAVAAVSLRLLFDGPAPHGAPDLASFGEAALGFVGACLGLALLFLGRHVHDEITVTSPWLGRTPVVSGR
ncbi:hypothetical protein [Sphingomonas sp.]|uniref:hypothetical protein n=1 Tax=Sphingomonas sp. TaxID=28214 RepID=UPI003CC5882D